VKNLLESLPTIQSGPPGIQAYRRLNEESLLGWVLISMTKSWLLIIVSQRKLPCNVTVHVSIKSHLCKQVLTSMTVRRCLFVTNTLFLPGY